MTDPTAEPGRVYGVCAACGGDMRTPQGFHREPSGEMWHLDCWTERTIPETPAAQPGSEATDAARVERLADAAYQSCAILGTGWAPRGERTRNTLPPQAAARWRAMVRAILAAVDAERDPAHFAILTASSSARTYRLVLTEEEAAHLADELIIGIGDTDSALNEDNGEEENDRYQRRMDALTAIQEQLGGAAVDAAHLATLTDVELSALYDPLRAEWMRRLIAVAAHAPDVAEWIPPGDPRVPVSHLSATAWPGHRDRFVDAVDALQPGDLDPLPETP